MTSGLTCGPASPPLLCGQALALLLWSISLTVSFTQPLRLLQRYEVCIEQLAGLSRDYAACRTGRPLGEEGRLSRLPRVTVDNLSVTALGNMT